MANWDPDIDVVITDSEDEDYENIFHKDFTIGREALLFVIDANLYKEKERFYDALKIINNAFISNITVNNKDMLGLVFANTEHAPEPYEPNCMDNIAPPDNCAVLLPLRQLTKGIVEYYRNFMELALKNFDTKYGIAENGGSFATMIRLCINLFDNASYPVNDGRIVYLTDKDTPHATQSHKYQMALQKARDLEGRSIEFNVIPMIDDFNYEPFYKEFISLARDVEQDSFLPTDAQQLREALADCKLKKNCLGRTLGHFNLSLGPDLEISAQYYRYFKEKYRPKKYKLLREDNSVLKTKNVIIIQKKDPDTTEILEEREIKVTEGWHEIQLGQMAIRITPEQINRVRKLHAPGMMLLGFKSKFALDDYVYYKPCNFMYPDDKRISGSKRLFRALWQRCKERRKIAVCLFMRKIKSIPRYVALVPVSADTSDDIVSKYALLNSDGFKIVYLPMAKHIRHNDVRDWNSTENTASEEGVQLFNDITKKLLVKYTPSTIYDPELKTLIDNILALGLNVPIEDDSPNDLEIAMQHDERIAKLIPKINEIFGTEVAVGSKKRPNTASANGGESMPKRAKITDDDVQNLSYVKGLVEGKMLNTCTKSQLALILEKHYGVKLAASASKQKHIDQIYELSQNIVEIN